MTAIDLKQMIEDTNNNLFDSLEVKILEHSVLNYSNKTQIVTFECFIPRCILAEVNTHRVFSRNTGSTRAIPVKKSITNVASKPFIPFYFGENQPGMQSKETMVGWKLFLAKKIWNLHRRLTLASSFLLMKLGLHKMWAGRILEPHSYVKQVITATSYDNFFTLRIHGDAQPEIVVMAHKMKELIKKSIPKELNPAMIHQATHWHLPYITKEERIKYINSPEFLAKISASRCARTSYLTQDGVVPNVERELRTFKMLAEAEPIHASPLEHQAYPAKQKGTQSRNFTGFIQYRAYYEEKEFGAPIVIPKV